MRENAAQGQTPFASISWFEQALRADPSNRSAQRGLGFALLQKGNDSAVVDAWQKTSNMGRELYHMGQQADRVINQQRNAGEETTKDSLKWYNLATQVDPSLRDPWYHMGQLYQRRGEWQAAEDAYHNGLKSTHGVRIESSDLLFWLARIAEKQSADSGFVAAMALYDRALTENNFGDPWVQAQTHFRRGEILRTQEKLAAAMQAYETAVTLNPKNYWGLYQLSSLAQTVDGDMDYAEELLERAIDVDANHFAAYRQLGLLYQQINRTNDAQSMYENALARNPDDAVSREQLDAIK